MGRIKILFIIDKMEIGGTERQIHSVISRLNLDLFEPILCCLRDSRPGAILTPQCEKIVLYVNSFYSVRALCMLYRLVNYLKTERIQIVQTFFIDATIMGMLAAWLAGVKVRISCRRDLGFWYKPATLIRMKATNRLATRFLANSNSVKEVLCKKEAVPPDRVDVIYNGIDLKEFAADDNAIAFKLRRDLFRNPMNPVVGIVSNLNRMVKRVDVFVKAAGLVSRVFPDCNFLVVGGGPLMPQLAHIARKCGLEDKIRFVGSIENVSDYIKTIDIVVNSSDSEGFSNSILEAMAASKPIVATDVGGTMEMLTDRVDGLLVSPGNHDAMAKAICELLSRHRYQAELGLAAFRKVKETYSWSVIIKQIELYYLRLLGVRL